MKPIAEIKCERLLWSLHILHEKIECVWFTSAENPFLNESLGTTKHLYRFEYLATVLSFPLCFACLHMKYE